MQSRLCNESQLIGHNDHIEAFCAILTYEFLYFERSSYDTEVILDLSIPLLSLFVWSLKWLNIIKNWSFVTLDFDNLLKILNFSRQVEIGLL